MKEKGILLVLFTALISGFSIFINKFGVSGIDPYIFTFAKNIIVAGLFVSIILLFKKFDEIRSLKKADWTKLAFIGLLGGSIPFLLFFKGLSLTTAAKGAFIHKTMFIFVAVFAVFFLKEKISKKTIIAASLLIIGNALLLKFVWQALNLGDIMILAATLLWALEITLSKHTLEDISSEIVAFGRMFFGVLFIMPFLFFTGSISNILTVTVSQLLWISITSVFLLLYVYTFYSGLKYVEAHVAASILLLGSVVTTLLSVAFTGASVTIMQAAGMLMLVLGAISMITLADIIRTARYFYPGISRKPRKYL